MITDDYKSLKELTDAQKAKCDKVVKLLLELKKSDMFDIGDELLGCNAERKSEIDDYIYGPDGYWNVTIDTIVP